MSKSKTLILLNKMELISGLMFFDVILYLISQVSYHQHIFFYARLCKLINDDAEDGFAGEGDQGLWLRVGMGAQLSARPGYRYDRLHALNLAN